MKSLIRIFVSKESYFLFLNRHDKKFYEDLGKVTTQNFKMIGGSGVDEKEFPYTSPVKKDKIEIVYTGRILKDKGVIDLIKAMKLLDDDSNIIAWTKKHKIKIPYLLNNKNRYYVPDFYIIYNECIIIEEVKGYEENKKKNLKINALKKYCKKNNYICHIIEYEELNNLCLTKWGYGINKLRKLFKEGEFNYE